MFYLAVIVFLAATTAAATAHTLCDVGLLSTVHMVTWSLPQLHLSSSQWCWMDLRSRVCMGKSNYLTLRLQPAIIYFFFTLDTSLYYIIVLQYRNILLQLPRAESDAVVFALPTIPNQNIQHFIHHQTGGKYPHKNQQMIFSSKTYWIQLF